MYNRYSEFGTSLWGDHEMVEEWLLEIAKGIGRLFLNPLLYWFILLLFFTGYKRVKQERKQFGIKVFDIFSEWRDTWVLTLLLGIFISIISIMLGLVFSIETLLILSFVTIILSVTLQLSLLSASYTIGLSYILLLVFPLFFDSIGSWTLFEEINFTGLVILLAIFLLVESHLLSKTERNETFPSLTLGTRGSWIGQHTIKKAAIIPFFTLIPTGLIPAIEPYWPYLTIGGENYGLILFPFVIGYKHQVKGMLSIEAAVRLSKSLFWLAILVLLIAISSIMIEWLSLVAIVIAILGREYINYRHRLEDNSKTPIFYQSNQGLKVLSIIPGSPADRLDIQVGETITKVNGTRISNEQEFYEALQDTGAFFKIELLDINGEIRFVQSAIYEGDHHELGILFPSTPHREN
ncbi:PDZ domain-containing protein [Ornithinibacillus halophilus]|uniref:PDZ domain-containing protein n=1 Tax=Ornithinibacillus halophilus TaxID=930117 RepID=A0A1M5FBP7_9BACI|nr:PDZ domain-containing protein [Ornithinibacillus halophilus]SHF88869.1 PDZ domain-containing protein [Ornithinibacillus halophilus]